MLIQTYHGEKVTVEPGDWLVQEYYKGFLNRVYVFKSFDAAKQKKDSLCQTESYMMNSPKHFSVRQA